MSEEDLRELGARVEGLEGDMVRALSELVAIPARGPGNGGDGELEKTARLEEMVKDLGFGDVRRYDSPDPEVSPGIRPNLVVGCEGGAPSSDGAIWVISHTDIVPEGDVTLWESPPFEASLRDGKLYGRGTEDNGQGMVSSLFALKAVADSGIAPPVPVRLAFVADEETGSVHGIQHLISMDLFSPWDLILVPDYGEADGLFMEVAEKGIIWMRVRVEGRSAHASMPQHGLNASRVAIRFTSELDTLLHQEYAEEDGLFVPPRSTFEPTRREANVENVNTIPGHDVSFFDCRVLPRYTNDEVLAAARELAVRVAAGTGAGIEVSVEQEDPAAPATSLDSPVVRLLGRAIKAMVGSEARPGGIGGGTCGAFFRRKGLPAVVWGSLEEKGHQPNEYARVSNMVRDAKVMAAMFAMGPDGARGGDEA